MQWITHVSGREVPEAARGHQLVDVRNVGGNTYIACDPKSVAWDIVASWRPCVKKEEEGPSKYNQGPESMPGVQDTLSARGKTHGDFDAQAATAQVLKRSVIYSPNGTHGRLKPYQLEALETICMKISRIVHGNPNEPDHWRDIAGYATLVENILVRGKSHM